MRAGLLKSRVQVQQLVETADRLGQLVPSWQTVATIWALVRSPTGRELFHAEQTKAVLSHVIECRWLGSLVTITPAHRLLYGTRRFQISNVRDIDERHRHLILDAIELVLPPETS